jgi:hypothetical protein
MSVPDGALVAVDWNAKHPSTEPARRGFAIWRTTWINGIQVRLVEYSAGYEADHWCDGGHTLHVLRGNVTLEHPSGNQTVLEAGQAHECNRSWHRSRTEHWAHLLIIGSDQSGPR